MKTYKFKSGDDIAKLKELDRKRWYAISCPVTGLRFDQRTLELMDVDHDGRVRTPEVIGAIAYLIDKGVDLNTLLKPSEADEKRLAEVMAAQADLANQKPSKDELKAMADWEAAGREKSVAVCGAATADAEAALSAVEGLIDAFFVPPEDMPLVTDEPDKELPLADHLNPKHLEAILAFAEKCVKPVLGERTSLTRLDWKKIKDAFAPYRAWVPAKPVMNAVAKAALEDEERLLRYKLNLFEFLENFITMKRLYDRNTLAVFQNGTLRIDGREMNLCFHVADEGAHSALVDKSNCCVIYLRLSRPSEGATRSICAVVTAGRVGGLYVGRNGVFYDRDGKDWEAVITKVIEAQVSLVEAFWAPWRKLGEAISGAVKKFLGDRQTKASADVAAGVNNVAAGQKEPAGGAAMASSVAAIGIGIGMVGAAFAALLTAVKDIHPWWMYLVIIGAIVLIVSLPSVILTWFKLRKRDLGAILNACGWAVNRPMRFSMRLARSFTKRLALALAVGFAASAFAREWNVNYDESKVGPYTLEDPLVFADGSKVKSAADWPKRRAEIVDIFAKEMYGRIPPAPEAVVTELREEGPTLAGLAIRRQYRMWFRKDKTGPFVDWLVVIPNRINGEQPKTENGRVVCENRTKCPVILMLNYNGNHSLLTDKEVFLPPEGTWMSNAYTGHHDPDPKMRGVSRDTQFRAPFPIEVICARGYALMTACYTQITPDVCHMLKAGKDGPEENYTGVFALWPEREKGATDNITSLGAWAWVMSRGLDFAFTIPEIDARRNVATGYSRLAKTPLLACSRDERFAVCIPNQTGGGGCPLAKRDFGESIYTEVRNFPHWYCRAYDKYSDNESAMKFDQHLLLASIAPRALLVQGFNSGWFDTKGEYLACRAASPAWEFLGRKGLPAGDFPANYDTSLIGPSLGYVRRGGEHGIAGYDWVWTLDFADQALKNL